MFSSGTKNYDSIHPYTESEFTYYTNHGDYGFNYPYHVFLSYYGYGTLFNDPYYFSIPWWLGFYDHRLMIHIKVINEHKSPETSHD